MLKLHDIFQDIKPGKICWKSATEII